MMKRAQRISAPAVTARTIVDVLRRRARETPSRDAYTFLDDKDAAPRRLTYAELDARVRVVAGWLQSHASTGSRALLLYPPGLDYVTAFLGCLYAGIVAVPAYPPRQGRAKRGQARLEGLIEDADVSIVLTDEDSRAKVDAFLESAAFATRTVCQATDTLPENAAEAWRRVQLTRESLAFLQYTSGSTAHAKGVMVSHGNIMHNERMIQEACAHTSESTFVGWLPLYHDMGLIGNLLHPLYIGASCVLMSPAAFLQKPVRWLRAISDYRGHTSGGPNFAYALCARKIADGECEGLDLRSWTVAFNGAEPLHQETLDAFAARFAPYGFRREAFYPCYGLAEATLIVSGGPREAAPITKSVSSRALEQRKVASGTEPGASCDGPSRAIVCSGTAVRHTTIRIVDPETRRACGAGEVGEIWVSGPAVAQGYWRQPEQTEARLRARLADGGRAHYLRTGDFGFLDGPRLFVTGRLRDLIIVRGQNHHPEDLEWTVLRSEAGRHTDSVVAFSVEQDQEERIVILIEAGRREPPSIDAIAPAVRRAIAEHHELQVFDVVVVEAGAIPKTSSGKVQRYRCREAWLDRTLPILSRATQVAAVDTVDSADIVDTLDGASSRSDRDAVEHERTPSSSSSIAQRLRRITARLLRISDIPNDRPLTALGLDSVRAIELQHHVESGLEATVDLSVLLDGATIDDIAARIETELAARGALAAPAAPRGQAAASSATLPALGTARDGALPMSHAQMALWFVHQTDPASAAYTISRLLHVTTPLERAVLEQAFARLCKRHPQLGATFTHDGQRWLQHPGRTTPSFTVIDAAGWHDAAIDEHAQRAAHEPFSLEDGPLTRITWYRRAAGDHFLLLSLHHIVADLWSFGIVLRHLADLIAASPEAHASASGEPEANTNYAGFVAWQSRLLASERGEALWTFWRRELAGCPVTLELAADRPRPARQTTHGARHRFEVPPALAGALRRVASERGVTLHMMLLAAFEVLVQRHAKANDFLVGMPVAGRSRAEFAEVVGCFMNVVPVRVRVTPELTFGEVLDEVRRRTLAALDHQDYTFSLLVERMQPTRDASRPPLCQVLFAWQRAPHEHGEALAAFALQQETACTIGGLRMRARALRVEAAPFELSLTMAEAADALVGAIDYNTGLFEPITAARIAERLIAILEESARDPQMRVGAIAGIPEAERLQIMRQGSGSVAQEGDQPADGELPVQAFERQVRARPDAVAVVAADTQSTYAGLDADANRLARELRARGAGPERIVGLHVTRSARMVRGMLAIMKTGGAFLPLDPDYPDARLTFMERDAGVRLLLTERGLNRERPRGDDVLDIDDPAWSPPASWRAAAAESRNAAATASTASSAHPSNLAYVIYTSGSTGTPKGVQISNAALCNFMVSMPGLVDLGQDDVMMALTSLSFDIAALELLTPLTIGARVCVAGREEARDAARLSRLIREWQITVMQSTPSGWRLLINGGWSGEPGLGILCGGEALSPALAARLRESGRALHNLYGPTETTIWSTVHRAGDRGSRESLGSPIANTSIYVLDEEGNHAPIGVPGELFIGGSGVARGYFGRAALTADRFVPDAFGAEPGARLYRTGDIVRWDANGLLHFIGRGDRQIKLRGWRIELGEIEAALRADPAVRDAAVVARPHGGDLLLAAYVVPRDAGTIDVAPFDVAAVRERLAARLPSYMTPASFTLLDAMPWTPNGKLDRAALPAPAIGAGAESRPPRTPLEQAIAVEWARLLECAAVGADDDFFALGGHSLLATQLVWQLQDALPTSVPLLALLLTNPTVAGFAAAIEQHLTPGVDLAPRLDALRRIQMMSDEEIEITLRDAAPEEDAGEDAAEDEDARTPSLTEHA